MTAPLWWNVAFDEPLPVFIETTTGVSSQAILSSHPGAYAIKGPWLVESDATAWLTKNAKPAFGGHGTWPPAPPGSPPSSGGSGGGNSGGQPGTGGTGGGGDWWVVLTGTTSQNLAGKTVQSSTRPARPAGALSQVLGPYQTHDEAYTAELDDLGGKITAKAGNPVSGALTGLNAIGNFFNELGQANTWIRAGEVLLGIILIGIGIARITGAENAISSAVKNIKVLPV